MRRGKSEGLEETKIGFGGEEETKWVSVRLHILEPKVAHYLAATVIGSIEVARVTHRL